MNSPPNVLFTRELKQRHLEVLENVGFNYLIKPFIRLEVNKPGRWLPLVSHKTDAWVFTSSNAAEIVTRELGNLVVPEFIFGVGERTANLLQEYGLEVEFPEVFTAEDLLTLILECEISSLTYFCGNLKATDLEGMLAKEGISTETVEVYRTKLYPHQIDVTEMEGIVFMSPSSVRSFFEKNSPQSGTKLFSLGSTTARELAAYYDGKVILPEEFTFPSLVKKINQTLC